VSLTLVPRVADADPPKASAAPGRLTNLDHLDFLGDRVAPPAQARHTTYLLDQQPEVGVLWTYADKRADGYERVGGGAYDAAKDTYGQGAFNADDMARAAVVYLRDWQQTGDAASRRRAFDMLRGLTYLQTTSGRNAGNVVLWMQPDGSLNPSAEPVELPDPSDSDASYWLARTVWALGEGYAAFKKAEPAFARFLEQRMDLALGAIDRQVLDAYGRYLDIDGRRTPAWLVADGADGSAEAVLGLAAYVEAGGKGGAARRVMTQLSEGIAQLAGGDARTWPFGGVLPWALSRSDWHAWGSQMPAALARAADVTGNASWRRAAARDSFTFDPWMLTSGGPDNGRLPARADATQIAYGVDSRVQSLIATGGGARQLAGMTAAWFFGANASRMPTYDPATGVTIDGVAADGIVNQNSGAESTIHGLLTMLALDGDPAVRSIAMTAGVQQVVGVQYVQAEDGHLGPGATAVKPASTWTGESAYAGTGFASLADRSTARFELGSHPDALVMPVVDLQPGSSAVTTFKAGNRLLGSVRAGAVGAQGDSPALGALLPVTLGAVMSGSAPTVTATTRSKGGDSTRLDALMIQPLVSRFVLGGDGHGTALLRSAATSSTRTTVSVPGTGTADVWSYDGQGRLLEHTTSTAPVVPVNVAAGGVTLVRR
jgi:hypothetical protein